MGITETPGNTTEVHAVAVWDEADIGALESDWRMLTAERPNTPVFASPLWFKHWRKQFGRHGKPGVIAVWDREVLIGCMPIFLMKTKRGPALSVRSDYNPADSQYFSNPPRYRAIPIAQLSPAICSESGNLRTALAHAPHRRVDCIHAIAKCIVEGVDHTIAIIPVTELDRPHWVAGLEQVKHRVFIQPDVRYFQYRHALQPWDQFLAGAGSHFRKRIRQNEKHFSEANLRCEYWDQPDQISLGFQALREVSNLSWKTQNEQSNQFEIVPYTQASADFFEAIVNDMNSNLKCMFCVILDDKDKPRAILFNLIYDNALTPVLIFFDPKIGKLSPGRFLMKGLFDYWQATEGEAFQWIDMNATHEWVKKYVDGSVAHHNLLIFGRGIKSLALSKIFRYMGKQWLPLRE